MSDRSASSSSRALAEDGVSRREGAFAPGPALWVGTREVAHIDDERTLDVGLTKAEIRRRREELRTDHRVSLRRNTSDWLEITIESDEELEWATAWSCGRRLQPNDGTARTSPTATDLERRERFY